MAYRLFQHTKPLIGQYLRFSSINKVLCQSDMPLHQNFHLHHIHGENKQSRWHKPVPLADEVVMERAAPCHYQGVLDILPDLFGGADCLFLKYHTYLTDPSAHPWVGILDNKVIAFVNYYVINNSTACAMTGGRIAPHLASKGIMGMLFKSAQADAISQYPNIKTTFYSAFDSKFFHQIRSGNSRETIVYDRNFLHYRTDTKSVRNLLHHLRHRKMLSSRTLSKIINLKEVEALLLENPHIVNFFPEGYFLHGLTSLPLEVTKENIMQAAVDYGTTVAITLSHESKYFSGISFGSFMQTPVGPSCANYFYVEDIDSLMNQLCCHLVANKDLYEKSSACVFELGFPQVIDRMEVKRELFQFLGETTISDDVPSECALIVKRPLV